MTRRRWAGREYPWFAVSRDPPLAQLLHVILRRREQGTSAPSYDTLLVQGDCREMQGQSCSKENIKIKGLTQRERLR